MRRLGNTLALLGALAMLAPGCGDPQPPITQVGVNVVEKSAFTGSWYMHRTVIDMEYAAAPLDYVGDNAGDPTGGFLGMAIPRIRWVIDENFLYAYRDYELVADPDDPFTARGDEDEDYLGQPVAAFRIDSHFDIQREYDPVTGEERNRIVENTSDRHWYERQFMRVDWSSNLISGYFGNSHNLSELFGEISREPVDLFVQEGSEFPDEYRPQFHFMSCAGPEDTECQSNDRDWASDYEEGTLYSMSFVTQEVLSPQLRTVNTPWGPTTVLAGGTTASVAIWVRTSFLRVSDHRDYQPVGWTNDRFNRAGYFALDRPTYDRSSGAGDPSYGFTDFTNQSTNRHNIWMQWFARDGEGEIIRDEQGRPELLPYTERDVRKIVWYTSSEVPAHLVKPSFELVGEWNQVLMSTVRQLRGQDLPTYQPVDCQSEDPGAYCFCQEHPETGEVLNPTCPGRYDPFESPEAAASRLSSGEPFDCYAAILDANGEVAGDALSAEPDFNDPALGDADFNGWYEVGMVGSECVNELRINTCHQGNKDEWSELDCQRRGDIRFKLLSFVDQPGTPFLGVAQLRGDPLTGEVLVGDANIGGPAMNTQRTRALEAYDLIKGNITEGEYYTGEDIRAFLNSVDHVELPATPRIDFSTAMRLGTSVDPIARGTIDSVMSQTMQRAELLRGAEGRTAIMSDRLQRLAGTPLERRLLSSMDGYALAGVDRIPEGVSPDAVDESLLEHASPFRHGMLDRMGEVHDFHTRLGLANMILPNAYTDYSVLSFVNRHRNWTRARVEFELNRRLYRDTQVHEMGHCLGLRHHFGGTADSQNYFDGYYTINDAFPLPDPAEFADDDGEPGLSGPEQIAYEDVYFEQRRLRELAGIDQWMNSSVMDYTPNWYQRINGAAPHDHMAISFGYGDIVDIYHNVVAADGTERPPLPVEEIHPVNTKRVPIKYYHGGESCTVDTDCPFNPGGARGGELLDANMSSGLVQTCTTAGRDGGQSVCSSFDTDARVLRDEAGASPEWVPVEYFYCEDIRASTRTVPGCATFDEGDSYREIVRNAQEAYERSYLFRNFRRYRANFSIGGYFNGLLRYLDPLLGIYQNLIHRYATDPEFRDQTGPFGFYDEFLATADIMNFFARMLAQPSIGSYTYDPAWDYYYMTSLDVQPGAALTVPFGQGRYQRSLYQTGLNGLYRIERIGSFYDSIIAMQLLTFRGLSVLYGPDVGFLTNFYDIFPNEMQQIFTGMINERPQDYMPRLECAPGSPAGRCEDARIVYMDFYRGDCAPDPTTGAPDPATCRKRPEERYADLEVLNGGTLYSLRAYAAIYALANFPIYYDTTFQNQIYLCVEGNGECYAPDDGAVEGEDYVRFTSRRLGKSFLAWQVEPSPRVASERSIAFTMVKEARDYEFIVRMLRTYRGDFEPGDPAPSVSFIDAADYAYLTDPVSAGGLGYTLPVDNTQLQAEIDRLSGRVQDLEIFFTYMVQLQREFGIQFPFLYRRPEI